MPGTFGYAGGEVYAEGTWYARVINEDTGEVIGTYEDDPYSGSDWHGDIPHGVLDYIFHLNAKR
jgi:hypothetical protein